MKTLAPSDNEDRSVRVGPLFAEAEAKDEAEGGEGELTDQDEVHQEEKEDDDEEDEKEEDDQEDPIRNDTMDPEHPETEPLMSSSPQRYKVLPRSAFTKGFCYLKALVTAFKAALKAPSGSKPQPIQVGTRMKSYEVV